MPKAKDISSIADLVSSSTSKKLNLPKLSKRTIIVIILVIVALIPSGYFYYQYRHTQNLLNNPGAMSADEAKMLVAKVGTMMVLPTGENPTIATVSDVTKLVGQPFFAKAQNGDKVLIYGNAKKAILYRPSLNKIVEVGPINTAPTPAVAGADTAAQGSPTQSLTPTPTSVPATVEIYNGTKTAGLASSAENKVKQAVTSIDVVGTGNAQNDYDKTIVVDISGKQSAVAKEVAAAVNGTVASLPSGEKAPSTDILVILGNDYK